MAQIITKRSWYIDENLFEDQAIGGRITTANTLDVTLKSGEHIGGINVKNVSSINEGKDVEISYDLVWTEDGPRSSYLNSIKLSDIAIARPVIVHFERSRGNTNRVRRNGESVDAYLITINTKKGELSIEVESDEFICIMVKTASGDRQSVFGYIKDSGIQYSGSSSSGNSGRDMITFRSYVNTQGIFTIRDMQIFVDEIVGIFKYKVELRDYIPKVKEPEEIVSE